MRLNPFNPGSINVRRGGGGGGFPGGGGGQLGCGAIVIALIGAVVFGIDPGQMLGTMEGMQQGTTSQADSPSGETAAEICDDNQYATEACNALGSLNQSWEPLFGQAGISFRQPTLVFYQGGTRSGCGAASSAMGPFYCPADQKVYIDLGFYETLKNRLGAPGDFAQAYVIAHEVGHHVQNQLGISGKVDQMRGRVSKAEYNALSVRLELQADCFAGVWAHHAQNARQILEQGDVEEAMNAAAKIGDDALQRSSGGAVVPESFTHGTSAQRQRWFHNGLQNGSVKACDTFAARSL